jgi:hypothetical protein
MNDKMKKLFYLIIKNPAHDLQLKLFNDQR